MKILVVEDEKEINRDIFNYLTESNHVCDYSYNKFDAEDLLIIKSYDLVILDINLPDGTGLELLKWLKKENIQCGVLMISARGKIDDKIEGLDLGTDDYLTKPIHLAELNSRVKAILRRHKNQNSNQIHFKEITLNTESRTVKVNNQPVELTPNQFDILEFFLKNFISILLMIQLII